MTFFNIPPLPSRFRMKGTPSSTMSFQEQWWKSALFCLRDTRPSSPAKKASPWKQVAALPLWPKASRTREKDNGSAVPQLGIKMAKAAQYYYSMHCYCATDRNFISAFEEEAVETAMFLQHPPRFWDFGFSFFLMIARMSSAAPARLHVCSWCFWQLNGRQGWILNIISCSTQKLIPAIFHLVEAPCN